MLPLRPIARLEWEGLLCRHFNFPLNNAGQLRVIAPRARWIPLCYMLVYAAELHNTYPCPLLVPLKHCAIVRNDFVARAHGLGLTDSGNVASSETTSIRDTASHSARRVRAVRCPFIAQTSEAASLTTTTTTGAAKGTLSDSDPSLARTGQLTRYNRACTGGGLSCQLTRSSGYSSTLRWQ